MVHTWKNAVDPKQNQSANLSITIPATIIALTNRHPFGEFTQGQVKFEVLVHNHDVELQKTLALTCI